MEMLVENKFLILAFRLSLQKEVCDMSVYQTEKGN